MKKLMVMMLSSAIMMFTGCDMSESTLLTTANTAGTITMLTWFSIDNPDTAVKSVLKDVIGSVTKASVDVGAGKTYLESVLPEIQEMVLKMDNLNEYQKTLINAGSVVILNGIDTFLAQNGKVKKDTELVNRVVGAFGGGCLTILKMEENCPQCVEARKVYNLRSMKCRGGKFVMPE